MENTDEIYKKMLRAKRSAYKSINKYLDLKIAYIDKAKEEGIYNPELMKKLKEVSVEV